MNDELLKNTKLEKNLKKLVKAVLNGNFDKKFCDGIFSGSIVNLILAQSGSLLRDFGRYANKQGFIAVEFAEVKREVFDVHNKSQFGDLLCDSFRFNMRKGENWISAVRHSIYDTVSEFRTLTRERILSECNGAVDNDQFKIIADETKVLGTDIYRIIDAVEHSNKHEFTEDIAFQTGLEAGPKLGKHGNKAND